LSASQIGVFIQSNFRRAVFSVLALKYSRVIWAVLALTGAKREYYMAVSISGAVWAPFLVLKLALFKKKPASLKGGCLRVKIPPNLSVYGNKLAMFIYKIHTFRYK
jgi:hypothetical protein